MNTEQEPPGFQPPVAIFADGTSVPPLTDAEMAEMFGIPPYIPLWEILGFASYEEWIGADKTASEGGIVDPRLANSTLPSPAERRIHARHGERWNDLGFWEKVSPAECTELREAQSRLSRIIDSITGKLPTKEEWETMQPARWEWHDRRLQELRGSRSKPSSTHYPENDR